MKRNGPLTYVRHPSLLVFDSSVRSGVAVACVSTHRVQITVLLTAALCLQSHLFTALITAALVVCYPPTRYYTIMPMDASASLMQRRYRMYTTRLSEADTDLYPIEEEQAPRKRWPLFALVGCSVAFLVLLSVSAAYTQEESSDNSYRGHSRASASHFPKFDIRNR